MNKPKTFAEVRDYLSSISAIHCGGCGVAALAMRRWLEKNDELAYEFRFVVCYDCQDEVYENNMKVLRTKNGRAVATSHIGIFNGDGIIDCHGQVYLPRYDLIQFVHEEWFMVNMINNKGTWNDWFNRQNIALIETALDIDLSDIKEQ